MRLRIFGIAVLCAVFSAGYLCGNSNQRSSEREARAPLSRNDSVGGLRPAQDSAPAGTGGSNREREAEKSNPVPEVVAESSKPRESAVSAFLPWYATNRAKLSLPELPDEILEEFRDEVVRPLGRIPEREPLLSFLDVYGRFYRLRQATREARHRLYQAMPELTADDPLLDPLFAREREIVRDFFANVRSVLGETTYDSLRQTEVWRPTAELAGVGADEAVSD